MFVEIGDEFTYHPLNCPFAFGVAVRTILLPFHTYDALPRLES